MNQNNRHTAYRRRVKRKQRLRLILILSGSLLLLLALGFLIVGTLLAQNAPPAEEPETEETSPEDPPSLPDSVKAHPLYLETLDATTLPARLQALRREGATEAAVPLNRTNGALLYRSTVAGALGISSGVYTTTVPQATRQAKNYGIRLSGIWHVDAFEETNELLRSVRLSETASLLAEAAEGGMSDILLLAPDLKPESLEELILLSATVHRLEPDAVLGVAIPKAFLEAENSEVLIDDLVTNFDFLAIDAATVGRNETATEHVQNVASTNLNYLLRYNMRLILPYSADAQADIITAAEQYNAKSWLILPPDP